MGRPAVFFDLGDVLVHLRLERGLQRFADLARCTLAEVRDAASVYHGEQAHRCYAGEISTEAFLRGLTARLGCPELAPALAVEAWCDIFDLWPEMESLAAEVIEAGHPTYLLSNTEPVHFELLRKQIPVLGRFTDLHLSYEVRAAKPDPRFYRLALERFSLPASSCLFVDDREENVEAARREGIGAVLHRGDVDEVRAFLRENGVRI
ncbi:HAD family hydrolase [Vulgatibacter sp.]|uniref:HAD family hydrolase n=1 Tax=Vulgatibacter sp. TaxID=1971226 RepID=UPI00356A8B29